MSKLKYKNVFMKYNESFSDRIATKCYKSYKNIRIKLKNHIPIKEYEIINFDKNNMDKKSTEVPLGFSYNTNASEKGYVKLYCIDIYDFLPKEKVEVFKKKIIKLISKYGISKYGLIVNSDIIDRLENMGQFFDHRAFSSVCDVNIEKNSLLSKYATQLSVEIRNLSFSFLTVRFRFYIKKDFNILFEKAYSEEHPPFTKISRKINTPWYKPNQFGVAYYSGNNKREENIYHLINKMKWELFCELNKLIGLNFSQEELFPPTFCTYSTNIRPGIHKIETEFWRSILFNDYADYSIKYNACVCFNEHGAKEGTNLSAYCGGKYKAEDIMPEFAEHELSNIYGTYMVASCLNRIAIRDIALCNKSISKAITSSSLSRILRVRVKVNRKLYYSNRFISEFSGNSIDKSDLKELKSYFLADSSISEKSLTGICDVTKETKKQIDSILNLLNSSAEYGSVKSNISIQWIMLIITLLSLVITILTLFFSGK